MHVWSSEITTSHNTHTLPSSWFISSHLYSFLFVPRLRYITPISFLFIPILLPAYSLNLLSFLLFPLLFFYSPFNPFISSLSTPSAPFFSFSIPFIPALFPTLDFSFPLFLPTFLLRLFTINSIFELFNNHVGKQKVIIITHYQQLGQRAYRMCALETSHVFHHLSLPDSETCLFNHQAVWERGLWGIRARFCPYAPRQSPSPPTPQPPSPPAADYVSFTAQAKKG